MTEIRSVQWRARDPNQAVVRARGKRDMSREPIVEPPPLRVCVYRDSSPRQCHHEYSRVTRRTMRILIHLDCSVGLN